MQSGRNGRKKAQEREQRNGHWKEERGDTKEALQGTAEETGSKESVREMIRVVKTVADMKQAIKSGVCYISGPISRVVNYKENFARAENVLMRAGMIAINPAYMPEGLPYDDYFPTCYAQIGISNALCFLPDYAKSTGAAREAKRAQWNKKEYWMFTLEQFWFYRDYAEQSAVAAKVPESEKEIFKMEGGVKDFDLIKLMDHAIEAAD